MTLIGENIHIISSKVKDAIIERNEDFILNLVQAQINNGIKTIDLNIGPAKNNLSDSMKWLIETILSKFDVNFSLDTTNIKELENGFETLKNTENSFLNSASSEPERLNQTTDIAKKYNSNLIALTLNSTKGIPKTPEERLELAFEMVEVANEKGIENNKIYIDPLVLPVSVEQSQAMVTLDSIRMFKESFEPEVKTVIGLSNISNGSNPKLRPIINKVFLSLALGAGLDSVILDGLDSEIIKIYKSIKGENIEINPIYKKLYEMSKNFDEIENISYDKNNSEDEKIIKTAKIILNKEIYTHSYIKEN